MSKVMNATWHAFEEVPEGTWRAVFNTHAPLLDDELYIVGPSKQRPDCVEATAHILVQNVVERQLFVAHYELPDTFSRLRYGLDARAYNLGAACSELVIRTSHRPGEFGEQFDVFAVCRVPDDNGLDFSKRVSPLVCDYIGSDIDPTLSVKTAQIVQLIRNHPAL